MKCSGENNYIYAALLVLFASQKCSMLLLYFGYILHFDVFGNLNLGQCKRHMLLCNSHSNSGNASGHFGTDLHKDRRECGLRVEIELASGREKRKI